jgi:hypothetical protein
MSPGQQDLVTAGAPRRERHGRTFLVVHCASQGSPALPAPSVLSDSLQDTLGPTLGPGDLD